jgi:antitoxin HicB
MTIDGDREQRIAELLRRPYHKVIRGEPIEGYLAEVPELPGCLTAGATEHEALENLREAMAVWFEWALAEGRPIPQPSATFASRAPR